MAEPELENNIKQNDVEEIVAKKKERKPLSEEAKKKQLANLQRGREMAHQKRRELEARYKEDKKVESQQEPEPEQVVERKVKVPKKKKIVYVEEDSSSSEEEIVIKRKKEKKVAVKQPPAPQVNEELERKRIMELVRQNNINQQKLKNRNAYMASIFGE